VRPWPTRRAGSWRLWTKTNRRRRPFDSTVPSGLTGTGFPASGKGCRSRFSSPINGRLRSACLTPGCRQKA
jgi:hypothetical protein